MKKMNLWKLFFTAMMVFAATAFTACVDDNEDNGMPFLDVNPETLAFSLDGVAEGASSFEIKTNRPWTLTPLEGSEWVTVEPMEGRGNATVEVSVPATNEGRVATLEFQLRNSYGAYMTKTVNIKQGDVVIPGLLPTQVVTEFGDDFTNVVNNAVYESPYWAFTSTDAGYPANPRLGWFGTIYSDGSRYLQCAPFNSKLATVDCYAIMTPFNIKGAQNKTLTFKLAWYANTQASSIDDTKIEVVASTTVTDETISDNSVWTVLKTVQYKDGENAMNTYFDNTVDLSAYANDEKVYVAFRYVGHNVTYRLDDVSFNGGKGSSLVVDPETLSLGAAEGATATINITASDPWEAAIASGEGFMLDKTEGTGDDQIVVTASAGNDTADEKTLGTVTVTSVAGTKTVTVKQKGQSNDIYYESFGTPVKEGTYWPNTDKNPTNVKQGYGFVSGTSEYKGYSTTARTVPNSDSPNPPCSAAGHCWFPAGKTYDKNYFEVEKLVPGDEKNLSFEFVVRGNTGAYKEGDLKLEISQDGSTWRELSFTVGAIPGLPAGGDAKNWQMASKAITLKAAVQYLYVRWSSETADGVRMDDPRIFAGTGGEEVDFGAPAEASVVTVAASKVAQTTATVGGELKNAAIGDYSAVGVQYAERPASGSVDWSQAQKKAATLATPWSVDLTDLTKATVYVFRAYATPKTGDELYSAEATFTTLDEEVNPAGNVIVNFSSADIASPALPTDKTTGTATYTIDGREYVVSSSSYYWIDYSTKEYGIAPFTALYLKGLAANNTTPGYIQFPAIEGKKLTRVEAVAAGNMGGSVMVSIVDTENNVIEGGASTKFTKPSVTFTLTGTQANTAYRFYVDASNAQINKLGLTYEDDGAAPQPSLTPATASMEFAAEADATGQTQDYTISNADGLSLFATVADATNFKAEVNDKTVKVTTLTANETAEARTTTVTVYLAATQDGEKKATATINVTQAAKAAASSDITIPELLALNKGDKVSTSGDKTLKAVVCGDPTGDNFSFGTMYVMTEGATTGGNGIVFYNAKSAEFDVTKYPLGTKLIITLKEGVAAIDEYSGTKQVTGVTNADIATDGTVTVTPITVTPGKLAEFVSMPVTVQDASIGEGGIWCTAKKGGVHTFTTAGTNFVVSVNKRAAMFQDIPFAAATGSVSGIGILFNGVGQIAPRNLEDVKAFEVTSPVILDVTPSSLSWNFDNTAAQEVNVSVAGASAALSVNTDAIAPFTASVSGTTITVTPPPRRPMKPTRILSRR